MIEGRRLTMEATMKLISISLIVTFVLGMLAILLPIEAQETGKVRRIGFLSVVSPSYPGALL